MIRIKRIYEESVEDDGRRVLVDRLWPRGLTKKRAKLDAWLKDIAPSTALRLWFRHDPGKWPGFVKRYKKELVGKKEDLRALKQAAERENLTLLYASRDRKRNEAAVLKDILSRLRE